MSDPRPTVGGLVEALPVGVPTTITIGGVTIRATRWPSIKNEEWKR